MLIVEDIVVHRGRRLVLGPASLALRPGEFVAICGPNGAGKTTLIKALSGELPPTAGAIRLEGHDLRHFDPRELASIRAVVPQATVLEFSFSVEEVVQLGASVPGFGRDVLNEARQALDEVGLSRMAERLYVELSGGERQRVHFARALCQLRAAQRQRRNSSAARSRLLLLDEPTANLDLPHQGTLLALSRQEADRGTIFAAVLHDLNLAARWADRIILIADGKIIGDGTANYVITDELLSRAYGCPIRTNQIPEDRTPFVLPQMVGS